jgi:hypothetical protein
MTIAERCRQAGDQWLSEAHETLRELPEFLYHYTSGEGLHGILSTNSLRGSNFAFMNDASEFSYGVGIARTKILAAAERTPEQSLKRSLLLAGRLLDMGLCDAYLSCFCEAPDLLSQWRGYGANSGRYCIEFAASELARLPGVSPLGAVVYDGDTHARLLARMVDIYLQQVGSLETATRDEFNTATSSIASAPFPVIVRFKDPSFHEECEWRCVILDWERSVADVDFVRGDGSFRPYRTLIQGTRLPIKRVIAGRANSNNQVIRVAEMMLKKYGYSDVKVEASAVPLRSWSG